MTRHRYHGILILCMSVLLVACQQTSSSPPPWKDQIRILASQVAKQAPGNLAWRQVRVEPIAGTTPPFEVEVDIQLFTDHDQSVQVQYIDSQLPDLSISMHALTPGYWNATRPERSSFTILEDIAIAPQQVLQIAHERYPDLDWAFGTGQSSGRMTLQTHAIMNRRYQKVAVWIYRHTTFLNDHQYREMEIVIDAFSGAILETNEESGSYGSPIDFPPHVMN
jgi:hypothetical protein